MLARRGADRRRRARADDGAAARAARPARLVPRDGAERAAVPRLVDLRAHRHRDRGGGALATALFGFHARLALEARLRRARARARAARAGRLRAAVRAQGRDLGRRRLDRLPRGAGSSRTATSPGSGTSGGQRRLVLARGRPRDRAHRLVDPARRRLHALLAHAPRRASGAPASATCCRRSSSSASARSSCSRTRRSPGPTDVLTTVAAGGVGSRARAARADRRRDRRGVREHLLDCGLARRTSLPRVPQRLLIVGVAVARDRDLARHQPDALPAVPAPARRVLRAALRRPARRLARRRAALRRATTSSRGPRAGRG